MLNLIEKATIEFRRSLDIQGVEELLLHISNQLPANIHYVSKPHVDLRHMNDKGGIVKEQGSFVVGGTITRKDSIMASDAFETVTSDEDYQKASAMRFGLVPDWEETDYRPEILKLWQDTRAVVDSYFSARIPKSAREDLQITYEGGRPIVHPNCDLSPRK
jgi:hypothetical protein